MRIRLQFLLILVLCLMALPLAHDPQYNTGRAQRQVAAEPAAGPDVAPVYHILNDLTTQETDYLIHTTLIATKGAVRFQKNLFDYLLAWADQIDTYVYQHPELNFSEAWHLFLKSCAAKTSTKNTITGNAFLKALGQSPLAEEIIIYFLQEHLTQQLEERLYQLALGQHPIWGTDEDLLVLDDGQPQNQQNNNCSPREHWPYLKRWIQEITQIRPRPLGGRPYTQISGGTFLIKKYLPWRIWEWPLGNEENKIGPTISELWSVQAIGQKDLCTAISNQHGQRALANLGLSPLPAFVPPGHETALKRIKQYAANPNKNLPTVYQIYCRKMLIPQIFDATPSPKEQKLRQLELLIALRDLER